MATKPPSKGAVTAKKMAAGMKNMWDSAKRDFTEHTPLVKQEFMDMLDYAKNKTQLLKRPGVPGPSEINTQLERSVNIDVGAELLSRYKDEWSTIHIQTQNSSQVAAKLDSEIEEICNSLSQSHAIIQRCQDEFSCLSDTLSAVEQTQRKVESLGELLQKVEESITECCRVKSQLESERKQHSTKIQFEKHCVECDSKVEQLKNILAKERRETAERKKELAARDLAERQQTFQNMFNEQMAEYRQKGEVERPITGDDTRERAGSHLEDVIIEDEVGTASLDDFLSDVVLDESEGKEKSDVILDDTQEKEEGVPVPSSIEGNDDVPESKELQTTEEKA